MSLSSFFSSFLNVVHADAEEKEETVVESVQVEQAEEEAEEPEDLQPTLRDECKNSAKCAPLTRHFEHCREKVSSGKGFKGEDCVEELAFDAPGQHIPVHMMHCADACAAPKLFSKLK